MLKDRKEGQYWVEPFVGGANMIDKVKGNRIGADSNKYLIALLNEMSKSDFKSPDINEDMFLDIKENKDSFKDWIVGYAGFQLSFGAMWFSGYRKDKQGVRNYSHEAMRNVDRQAKSLQGIKFLHTSYSDLRIPENSIIYCDPPYENTAKYSAVGEFQHVEFWQWCRDKSKEGHTVFISEYNAPDDFECIWQQELNVSVAKNGKHKKAVEKLFTI